MINQKSDESWIKRITEKRQNYHRLKEMHLMHDTSASELPCVLADLTGDRFSLGQRSTMTVHCSFPTHT